MAEIKIKYAKVWKVKEVKNGQMLQVSEGHKQSDGTYENEYWSIYVKGGTYKEKDKIEDLIGYTVPNNWQDKDGKKHYDKTVMIKSVESNKEPEDELPFS